MDEIETQLVLPATYKSELDALNLRALWTAPLHAVTKADG